MKNAILLSLILCGSIFLSGCVIAAEFVVINNSADYIEVKYESGWLPTVKSLKDIQNGTGDWKELPPEKFEIDKEKEIVTTRLAPNEVLRITLMDIRYIDKQPDEHFDVKSLRLSGADGAVQYEGHQIFKQFKPDGYHWWTRSPNRYQITYK